MYDVVVVRGRLVRPVLAARLSEDPAARMLAEYRAQPLAPGLIQTDAPAKLQAE